MASYVKVGQLWKRDTGEYLVVKKVDAHNVYFHGSYPSISGGRSSTENLPHMTMCLNEGVGRYKLIDDVGYTIGMKFRGERDHIIKDFYEKEPGVLCVRYQDRKVGNWDRLPITYMVRIVEEEKQIEKSPSQDSNLYPPADTESAEGQIWQELNGNVWLLFKPNSIRLLECPTKWKGIGFEMGFSWEHFGNKSIWKCLSLATDRYKVGQVWVNRADRQPGLWTVISEDGVMKSSTGIISMPQNFTKPNAHWHLIKDAPPEEVKKDIPEVGDIYEWTARNYGMALSTGKRFRISKKCSEYHFRLEGVLGTFNFEPATMQDSKWKLVYKYGRPLEIGRDWVYEKSSGEYLRSHSRQWMAGQEALYGFYTEKGVRVQVAEGDFQQKVLSGDWTILTEEEVEERKRRKDVVITAGNIGLVNESADVNVNIPRKAEEPKQGIYRAKVGDIYEWTGDKNSYPCIRYEVESVADNLIKFKGNSGRFLDTLGDTESGSKWKLVYKEEDPIVIGYYIRINHTKECLKCTVIKIDSDRPTRYVFKSETGNNDHPFELTKEILKANVLSGHTTIVGLPFDGEKKEAKAVCYWDSYGVKEDQIKKEKNTMEAIEMLDISDVQIKEVDPEVIKDKQCELARLFGYEASENSKGEVIFRRAGKLSGGFVVTPAKLVNLFMKNIIEENGSGDVTSAALAYGIVESMTLVAPKEEDDE